MSSLLDQLRNDRHQFDKGELKDHLSENPIEFFQMWLEEAQKSDCMESNAIAISTLGEDGFPQSRILYLREIENGSLVFYTNYNSSKGLAIAKHPKVHGLIFWPELQRQISVSGVAEKVAESVSDAYFASRPRGSQLGAWASQQSEELSSRKDLEDRIEELEKRFPNEVPRPPHWGGYAIQPVKFEFWQGRPSRLHDRIVYELEANGNWKIYRKNP